MRRARNPEWIYLPNGDLAGIATGSSSVAEHEWGVEDIHRIFGCDKTKDGIDRRRVTLVPKYLQRISGGTKDPSDKRKKEKPFEAIFLCPTEEHRRTPAMWADSQELYPYSEEKLCCAWDKTMFGIVAYGEKDKKNLDLLWDAFQRKDVAFWTNIGVFHTGAGLVFCISSKVPTADVKKMYDSDLDEKSLVIAAEATGIEKELKAAGRRWYALSPRWAKTLQSTVNGDIKTKYPVVFWLNPWDQDAHNYGWWTVEILKEWAQGKGPVMVTEKQRRDRGR